MPIALVPITINGPLLDTRTLLAAATAAIRDTQAEGVRLMATYPPQRPNSHYRRTGTLKRSWHAKTVKMDGNALAGEIVSQGEIAPYNRKVEGDPTEQDPFFASRGWQSNAQLVKLVEKQFPPRIHAAFDKAAKGGGL